MKLNNQLMVLALLMGTVLVLQGCNSKAPEVTKATPEAQPVQEQAQEPEFIEMGNYKFKLAPEIMKSGEAHLDYYVRDAKGKHVLGVTGSFHVTLPDGTKESIAMAEEKPHDHYHGMLMLTQTGDYQVVAETNVNGEKFNPRFNFTRKE